MRLCCVRVRVRVRVRVDACRDRGRALSLNTCLTCISKGAADPTNPTQNPNRIMSFSLYNHRNTHIGCEMEHFDFLCRLRVMLRCVYSKTVRSMPSPQWDCASR